MMAGSATSQPIVVHGLCLASGNLLPSTLCSGDESCLRLLECAIPLKLFLQVEEVQSEVLHDLLPRFARAAIRHPHLLVRDRRPP